MFKRFFKWITSRKVLLVVLWILHFVLLIAITIGLWIVNRRYRLEADLLSPLRELHPVWLPLLFLLVYAGGWLAWWFFRLLTDPRTGEFPDIDDAWDAGLQALQAAGIDPKEVPVYLVVGKPRSTTADFFAATKLPFTVRAEPRKATAPVQVYATREAIFVTCEGACVLARASEMLAVEPASGSAMPSMPMKIEVGAVNLLDQPELPDVVLAGEPKPVDPTLLAGDQTANDDHWLPVAKGERNPSVPADEAARLAARLRHLCRLIAERRRPYCPANGVVWLLPVAATESETLADQIAAASAADRVAVEAGLQVYCPSVAVICDAQELVGFRDLLRGLPEPLTRERLLGRSFPLVPGVGQAEWPGVLAGGMDWVARHLVPGVAFLRFGSEVEGNGERWSEANARLWQLTSELVTRRLAAARLLAQGIADATNRPPMLAGAYFAATGPDERDQAFAAGIVQQLLTLQNNVAWTEAAVAEERDYQRMTAIGYAAALVLVIAVATFGYATWNR